MKDFTEYNSIFALVKDLPKSENEKACSNDESDKEWSGSATYDEAVERIVNGDVNLSKIIRGCDKLKFNAPCTGVQKRMVTRVAGFMPHVPNYLAGVPNNMIFCEERKIEKKVLRVFYGCNTRGDVDTSKIAKVSARLLSAIMSLERQGYRIELHATNCASKYKDKKLGFSVKLKDAGQHLDFVKCAFPLLSSAWNRRLGFRYREIHGWFGYDMGSSMDGDDLRSYLKSNGVKFDVALSFYDLEYVRNNEQLEELLLKAN